MLNYFFGLASAAFRSASRRSTSSFGTLINFRIKSLNAPNPLGFRSCLSAIAFFLLLNSHETSIANGGELLVSDPLPDDSLEQIHESSRFRKCPHVEAESLLVTVSEKMPRLDLDVRSFECSLEQREEILGHIDRDSTSHEFTRRMIDGGVVVCRSKSLACRAGVRVEERIPFDVSKNITLQRFSIGPTNDERSNIAIPLNDRLDRFFANSPTSVDGLLSTFGVHVFCFPADIGFVGFDLAIEFLERVGFHRKPNPMKHEPRCLLRDTNRSTEFVTADSVATVRDRPDGNKPLVETEWRVLEDGPDLHRELFLTRCFIALDRPRPRCNFLARFVAALRTNDHARGPLDFAHEVIAMSGNLEVSDGVEQRFWNLFKHDNPSEKVSRAVETPEGDPVDKTGPLGTGKSVAATNLERLIGADNVNPPVFVDVSHNCVGHDFVGFFEIDVFEKIVFFAGEWKADRHRTVSGKLNLITSVFFSPNADDLGRRKFVSVFRFKTGFELSNRVFVACECCRVSPTGDIRADPLFTSPNQAVFSLNDRLHFQVPLRNHPRLCLSVAKCD